MATCHLQGQRQHSSPCQLQGSDGKGVCVPFSPARGLPGCSWWAMLGSRMLGEVGLLQQGFSHAESVLPPAHTPRHPTLVLWPLASHTPSPPLQMHATGQSATSQLSPTAQPPRNSHHRGDDSRLKSRPLAALGSAWLFLARWGPTTKGTSDCQCNYSNDGNKHQNADLQVRGTTSLK